MKDYIRNPLNLPHKLSSTVMRSTTDIQLEKISDRIKERDLQLIKYANSNWLQTGNDLIEAKRLLKHGNFEEWCGSELSYSKSKAEKLMRAAELLGPALKSVNPTDLPPPTLAFTLSGRSVPSEIRDTFLNKAIAGEPVSRDLKAALKQHREQSNAAAQGDESISRSNSVQRDSELAEKSRGEAISEVLTLIARQFNGNLPDLIKLLDLAGSGAVFEPAAERALRDHVLIPNCVENDSAEVAKSTDIH